jgi:hypothetical protein
MKVTDIITEAATPAQQAAIAISMKKAGKKPKTEGMAEGEGGNYYSIALQMYPHLKQFDRATVITALNNAYEDYLMHYGYEGIGPDEERSMIDRAIKGLKQGVAESKELAEEFDLIESIVEMIAEHNGVDAEAVWEDLESLTEDELYVFAVTSDPLMEDWQKANKRDKTDGMSQKAVNAYRRENPGSKLKTAVTTKPGKLKKGGKASKRRKSYCSRSRGQMKMHSISCAKTPDKAICKARRRWNC